MPILTFNAPSKGTAETMTLSKAELAAVTSVDADDYFKVDTNWKSVNVYYKSTVGGQSIYVSFDATKTIPTGDFSSSSTARDLFNVSHIKINDFDGGYHRIERSELTIAEFDIDITEAPSTYILTTSSAGMNKTIDGGLNWTVSTGPISRDFIEADSVGDLYGFDATGGGTLTKSTNKGDSFSTLGTTPSKSQTGYPSKLQFGDNDRIFVMFSNRLLHTDDAGANWFITDVSLSSQIGKGMAVSPTNAQNMVIAGGNGQYCRYSTNNGDTFSPVTGITGGTVYSGQSSVVCNSLGHFYVATSSGVYKSTDGGVNFVEIDATLNGNTPNTGVDIRAMDISSDDKVYIASTTGVAVINASGTVLSDIVHGTGMFPAHLSAEGGTVIMTDVADIGTRGAIISIDDGASFINYNEATDGILNNAINDNFVGTL